MQWATVQHQKNPSNSIDFINLAPQSHNESAKTSSIHHACAVGPHVRRAICHCSTLVRTPAFALSLALLNHNLREHPLEKRLVAQCSDAGGPSVARLTWGNVSCEAASMATPKMPTMAPLCLVAQQGLVHVHNHNVMADTGVVQEPPGPAQIHNDLGNKKTRRPEAHERAFATHCAPAAEAQLGKPGPGLLAKPAHGRPSPAQVFY